MDLRWMIVAIAGCVGLALCIAAVLLSPMAADRRRLRPLANVGRLTDLPEYVRAVRLRTLSALIAIMLLVVAFAGAVLAGARPTGLPTATTTSTAGQPEDVMLCIGGPATDPAVTTTLRYFAERVPKFGTERIGLTSANRRVVPLTRDYQYVAGEFSSYASRDDADGLLAPVSYVDYAGGVEDLLALCLTGFPDFEQTSAQRRSVIYVGPDALRPPDDQRPDLFTADRVGELAAAAGAQVNVIVTDPGSDPESTDLAALARDTGGQSFPSGPDVATHLAAIRAAPPAATDVAPAAATTASAETPDLPIILALVAIAALAAVPLVLRR